MRQLGRHQIARPFPHQKTCAAILWKNRLATCRMRCIRPDIRFRLVFQAIVKVLVLVLLASTGCTRQHARIWAAGFQGAADGMSNRNSQTYQSQDEPECTSDYQCPQGFSCLKNRYASSGRCVQKVNEYGVPSYSSPDPASMQPNMGRRSDCTSTGRCPIGFLCDYMSGACLKP